jgi:hypothetical protein
MARFFSLILSAVLLVVASASSGFLTPAAAQSPRMQKALNVRGGDIRFDAPATAVAVASVSFTMHCT